MWHEARKQERLIRGLIVDYRRRAERRKDFYEKIVLLIFVCYISYFNSYTRQLWCICISCVLESWTHTVFAASWASLQNTFGSSYRSCRRRTCHHVSKYILSRLTLTRSVLKILGFKFACNTYLLLGFVFIHHKYITDWNQNFLGVCSKLAIFIIPTSIIPSLFQPKITIIIYNNTTLFTGCHGRVIPTIWLTVLM